MHLANKQFSVISVIESSFIVLKNGEEDFSLGDSTSVHSRLEVNRIFDIISSGDGLTPNFRAKVPSQHLNSFWKMKI